VITDADVDLVAGRLNAWSIALAGLADPDACRKFLTILDEGDGKSLHKLIDRWNLPGEVGCIEIVDTITRFVHTGDFEPVEKCSFVHKLRPLNPSTTSGVGYQLPDGTVLWLTESEWWQMMDHAVNDEVWRDQNHGLLVAVGIMFCTFEMVATIQRFDIDKRYTICTPTWDPRVKR
jgi:hypothetical protein